MSVSASDKYNVMEMGSVAHLRVAALVRSCINVILIFLGTFKFQEMILDSHSAKIFELIVFAFSEEFDLCHCSTNYVDYKPVFCLI